MGYNEMALNFFLLRKGPLPVVEWNVGIDMLFVLVIAQKLPI
jgi:hypothetical protein